MTKNQPTIMEHGKQDKSADTGTCETCGNTYENAIKVTKDGVEHTFDCFECAIQALAPKCEHCGCRIIGHGVEENGHIYCCCHCARESSHPHEVKGFRPST